MSICSVREWSTGFFAFATAPCLFSRNTVGLAFAPRSLSNRLSQRLCGAAWVQHTRLLLLAVQLLPVSCWINSLLLCSVGACCLLLSDHHPHHPDHQLSQHRTIQSGLQSLTAHTSEYPFYSSHVCSMRICVKLETALTAWVVSGGVAIVLAGFLPLTHRSVGALAYWHHHFSSSWHWHQWWLPNFQRIAQSIASDEERHVSFSCLWPQRCPGYRTPWEPFLANSCSQLTLLWELNHPRKQQGSQALVLISQTHRV